MLDSREVTTEPTPPAGDTPSPDAALVVVAEPEPTAAPERTYSAAEYRAVQNEAKNLRSRLRELEVTAAGHTPALEATAAERDAARAELAALSDEVRGHRLRTAIAEVARSNDDLGTLDPALAQRLLDDVEWDEAGRPKGLAAKVRALVAQYPQLLTTPTRGLLPQAPANGAAPRVREDDVIAQKRRNYPAL